MNFLRNIIIICLLLGISIGIKANKLNDVIVGQELNTFVQGETENLYLFENNQDYLLINGVKRKINFNRFKSWKASGSDILQSKNVLKSLDKLKKIIKNKKIKLMLYGYYDEHREQSGYQISSWAFVPVYNLFNYLDLKKVNLDKYNSKYGFKIKGNNFIFSEYIYQFLECTGDNQFIHIDNIRYTIHFDKEKSNKKALISLYALKWQIVYTTKKDIRFIGYYDKASKMFILKHWFLKPPFKYIEQNMNDGSTKTVKRLKFKKSDFKKDTYFGKANIDKPEIYHSSKYFYKKNKVIYLNKRKK